MSKSKSVSADGVAEHQVEDRPGDIAPAVAFLASVKAAWIAGETLRGLGEVR
jgi:NAD(P)-dependent dehydrogenase (short-subunit alcohol dehydrogenase family)